MASVGLHSCVRQGPDLWFLSFRTSLKKITSKLSASPSCRQGHTKVKTSPDIPSPPKMCYPPLIINNSNLPSHPVFLYIPSPASSMSDRNIKHQHLCRSTNCHPHLILLRPYWQVLQRRKISASTVTPIKNHAVNLSLLSVIQTFVSSRTWLRESWGLLGWALRQYAKIQKKWRQERSRRLTQLHWQLFHCRAVNHLAPVTSAC